MPATLVLPPDPASAALARRMVRAELLAFEPEVVDAAVIMVSELATNAVLHARTDFEIRVLLASGSVRVEVVDRNSRMPQLTHASIDATSGRGLQMVERLSDRCGSRADGSGKIVWFELDVTRAGPPRRAGGWSLRLSYA